MINGDKLNFGCIKTNNVIYAVYITANLFFHSVLKRGH